VVQKSLSEFVSGIGVRESGVSGLVVSVLGAIGSGLVCYGVSGKGDNGLGFSR
jgi:hypothetical protein